VITLNVKIPSLVTALSSENIAILPQVFGVKELKNTSRTHLLWELFLLILYHLKISEIDTE